MENDQIIYAPREMAIVAKKHKELNSSGQIKNLPRTERFVFNKKN